MGIEVILASVVKMAFSILGNEQLLKALFDSDELTEEEKNKITIFRKAEQARMEDLSNRYLDV